MRNIQAQYRDLLEGKMSKANFMRNVRMQFPQHVSPTTSYDDSVKILKGKRILSEEKKPIGVYGHNPNAEAEVSRGIDHLNYYQVQRGIKYELAKMPEITDESYVKARKKVVDAILKNPDAYKDLQLANYKAVKDMDKDLEMKEVKKDNLVDKPNEMKVVKKDVGGNTQATLEKKEKRKAKNGKGVQHMTQTPKGKLEAFPTPGKEKTLKEAHDGDAEDLAAMARSSNALRSKPETKQLAKKAAEKAKSKEEAASLAVRLAKAKGITDSEQITHIADLAASLVKEAAVQHLKEHILDELTHPNPEHEHIGKGSRVKKKGLKDYDAGQVGNVVDFDGDTATVKWDNDKTEHVQVNILTKRDIPQHPEAKEKFGKLPNLGSSGQTWASGQVRKEDKQSRLKKLKERLVKALKKETVKKNPKTGEAVSTGTPADDALATKMGYTQTVPSTIRPLGKM